MNGMTNREKILQMNDDDLALVLMCPYDTSGDLEDLMQCVVNDVPPQVKNCCQCIKDWLQKEAKGEGASNSRDLRAEIDMLYLEKCREVNALRTKLEEAEGKTK